MDGWADAVVDGHAGTSVSEGQHRVAWILGAQKWSNPAIGLEAADN